MSFQDDLVTAPIFAASYSTTEAETTPDRLAIPTSRTGRRFMLFMTENAAGYRAYLQRIEDWALKTLQDACLPTDLRHWKRPDGTGLWNVVAMVENRHNTPEWFAARILCYVNLLHTEESFLRGQTKPTSQKTKKPNPNYRPSDWDSVTFVIGLAGALTQEVERMIATLDIKPTWEIGLSFQSSGKKGAKMRWETTDRQARDEAWRDEASRLRSSHPNMSMRSIAALVIQNCNVKESLRTVQTVLAKKV